MSRVKECPHPPAPRITTVMVALAFSVVNIEQDREQTAKVLAQMILAVAERSGPRESYRAEDDQRRAIEGGSTHG